MGLSRRELLGGSAVAIGGLLWWRNDTNTNGFGVIGDSDVLRIPDGETIQAAGGTYSSIKWEKNGSLSLENGDSITLKQ